MAAFEGPVFRPGDDGYDAERAGFNLTVEHRPALIVGATGPGDVVAAVNHASAEGLAVGALTTGHGPAVPADDQVLINTRRMNSVQVDPATRTAYVGGGTRWRDVLPHTVPHGLAPLNGNSPDVGVVGYTLGGGIGPLGRCHGFAADRVRRIELVTADGSLRHVTADSDPELFWAIRGGKGNFGVVTGLEFELVPVSRLYGGGLFYPASATGDVLHTYRDWVQAVPDEMTSSVLAITFPPLPEIPELFRGKSIVSVRFAFNGSAEDGERLVKPFRDLGPLLLDTVAELPYAEVGTIYNDPTDPAPAYDSNVPLHTLDSAAVEALLSQVGAPLILELRHLGGAYTHQPAVPSAVGNRDAAFLVFAASIVQPGQQEAVRAAHDRLHDTLRPWSTGGMVYNLSGIRDAAPDRVKRAFDEATYERLAKAKAGYDPGNLFRLNFNIPPG